MTKVDAPRHLMLYCRKCRDSHLFHLRGWGASYYGDCVEMDIPESLLNQALGFEITIHTLLATFSSVLEKDREVLTMPRSATPWLQP